MDVCVDIVFIWRLAEVDGNTVLYILGEGINREAVRNIVLRDAQQ